MCYERTGILVHTSRDSSSLLFMGHSDEVSAVLDTDPASWWTQGHCVYPQCLSRGLAEGEECVSLFSHLPSIASDSAFFGAVMNSEPC